MRMLSHIVVCEPAVHTSYTHFAERCLAWYDNEDEKKLLQKYAHFLSRAAQRKIG